jgi:uncharacterized repeat protein (TIGR01451 family)
MGAAILPGPAPAAAAAAFTLRYSTEGWADVIQTGAPALACPAEAPACQDGSDPTAATSWADVDQDPSTVNSSRAVLAIPPKASVDWVGLYWAGDRGTRGDGVQPRCEAAPDAAMPPTLPPAPQKANQVKLRVGDKPYAVVTANSLTTVTGPDGGTGFQAYDDITTLVRPAAGAPAPAELTITVAELQVASGPGCGGGWTAVLTYSYADGPDRTYAPDFRSVAVFDGTLTARAGVANEVRLNGVPDPTQEGQQPRLTSSLFASGQALGEDALWLGSARVPRSGNGVTGITGQSGPGYQLATSPVPPSAIGPGAALGVTAARDGFVTAVLGLSTPLPAKVKLSVLTAVNPTTVSVGSEATVIVTVRNDADLNASGVKVTVRLAAGLRLVAAQGYDASTGTWSAGAVAAHGSAELSLRVIVEDTGDLVSTAKITASDIPNQNPPGDGSSVTVTAIRGAGPTAAAPAPTSVVRTQAWAWPQVAPATLFGIGLFLLGLLLLSLAVVRHRARAHEPHYPEHGLGEQPW